MIQQSKTPLLWWACSPLWKCTSPLASGYWIWLMTEPWASVFYSLSPPGLCPRVDARKGLLANPSPVLCSSVIFCCISWDIQALLLWVPRTLQHWDSQRPATSHTHMCTHTQSMTQVRGRHCSAVRLPGLGVSSGLQPRGPALWHLACPRPLRSLQVLILQMEIIIPSVK